MKHHNQHTTADRTILSLCDEIDRLKEAVAYWREMYETERAENNRIWVENMDRAKADLGKTISLVLAMSEDGDGNLVINKENRKVLAEDHKLAENG